jgi:hypothetical protein
MESTEKVILNLQDADCSEEFIQQFLNEPSKEKQLKLLGTHRRQLLNGIHDGQKKLDILDYLIFKMKQEQAKQA